MINKGIVLGSNDRAALETIRILGSSNHIIDNIYFTNKTICNYSKFLNKSFFLGDPEDNYSVFVKKLIYFLKENNYNYLIPINDIANEIVFNNFNKISKLTYIASNSKNSYNLCHSKYNLIIAKKWFKVPKTNYVKSISDVCNYLKIILYFQNQNIQLFYLMFLNRTN